MFNLIFHDILLLDTACALFRTTLRFTGYCLYAMSSSAGYSHGRRARNAYSENTTESENLNTETGVLEILEKKNKHEHEPRSNDVLCHSNAILCHLNDELKNRNFRN